MRTGVNGRKFRKSAALPVPRIEDRIKRDIAEIGAWCINVTVPFGDVQGRGVKRDRRRTRKSEEGGIVILR